MKKLFVVLLVFGILLFAASCEKTPHEDSGVSAASTPDRSDGQTITENGGETSNETISKGDENVSCQLKGEELTVSVCLPKSAGMPVSLLLLTDAALADRFQNDPSCVIDIDEITTGPDGGGRAVLTLPASFERADLVVTAPDGIYTRRIR